MYRQPFPLLRTLQATIVLLMFVLISGGCATYYYKQFVFDENPRYPGYAFATQDMMIGISVDANPVDESSYCDSSYFVDLFVSRRRGDECSARLQEILKSIELDFAAIRIGDTIVSPIYVSIDREGWCSVRWDFTPMVIPESIDTINVTLGFQYEHSERIERIDTTVTMTRLMGKAKELQSF